MLTLEEAVAELDKLLAFGWIEDRVGTRVNADEIRTAVRDVALATEQLGQDGMRHSEILAEIIRLFPKDSPHG